MSIYFFKKILAKICPMTHMELHDFLYELLCSYGYKPESYKNGMYSYLYAKGTKPILCVAHLDTVHHEVSKKILTDKKTGLFLFSNEGIGGDDRCGVAIIIALLKQGCRPSILFPSGEEVGGLGTSSFIKDHPTLDGINWMLEIDRAHRDDVVCYSDGNSELTEVFEKYGFKRASGTFTDISLLMPKYGISGVNVSSAYYNPHTLKEYIHLGELTTVFDRLNHILSTYDVDVSHKYIRSSYSSWSPWYHRSSGSSVRTSKKKTNDKKYFYTLAGRKVITSSLKKCCICDSIHKSTDLFDSDYGTICSGCVDSFVADERLIKCPSCGYFLDVSSSSLLDFYLCPSCGAEFKNKVSK